MLIDKINIKDISLVEYRYFFEKFLFDKDLLFNNPDFTSYRDGTAVKYIVCLRKQNPIAIASYWIQEGSDGSSILTVPGSASFGGLVSSVKLRLSDYQHFLNALLKFADNKGCSRIEWIPTSRQHELNGDDEKEFAAQSCGYEKEVVGLESIVNLPSLPDAKCRNLLKKCDNQNIVYLPKISLIDFHSLLTQTYNRHNANPTHSLEDLSCLSERFPQQIRFVGASFDDKVIGSACIFRIYPWCDLVFYLCMDDRYKSLNPLMRLLQSDMDRAFIEGVTSYNFGTSSIGLNLRENVWSFKKQFNARGYIRNKFVREIES